ncbi:DUF2341 domain-containing protein, partial [Methanosarcina sp. 2.H.T.1A.3]|uniref:DUF2341 domain-containing protein n=1 Tax=Methanosarcina sp. 2.H.T.1A.3 TaxID=1483597 RepID=UPI001F3E7DA6
MVLQSDEFEIPDIYPPEITIVSPVDGATYSTFPEINVTTNENATLVYSLNSHNETEVTQLVQHVVEGDNTLIIYATDLAGNTASREISFNYDPVPAAGFIANVTSGAVPLSVQFTDTSTNGPVSWSWDFGDNFTSAEQNPVHVYSDIGNFTVTLTAFNATGNASVTKSEYVRTVNESSGSEEPQVNATLSYWIEGVDSGDRTFVKVDELAPSETQVYAVHKEAGYEPNGSDVFIFYDNFSALDTSIWSTYGMAGTSSTTDGVLKLDYTGAYNEFYGIYTTNSVLPSKFVLTAYAKSGTGRHADLIGYGAVSYTHLTLPTIY